MTTPVKLGIVGLGRWAKVLTRAAAKSDKLSIVAGYSRSEDKRSMFEQETGVRAAPDLKTLLADPEIKGVILTVPNHYDAKGEADALFASLPTTFLRAPFYWDNLIHFGLGPRRAADGGLELVLPLGERKLPGIAAADIGACAFGVYARGAELAGQAIGLAGEHVSGAEMAAALSRALREPVRYRALAFSDYAEQGFPGGQDMANMFQYKHDFNDAYRAEQSVERSRELHPGLQDFAAWVAGNAHRIDVAKAAA